MSRASDILEKLYNVYAKEKDGTYNIVDTVESDKEPKVKKGQRVVLVPNKKVKIKVSDYPDALAFPSAHLKTNNDLDMILKG